MLFDSECWFLYHVYKALEDVSHAQLEDCYQHVSILKEQLQELRSRFRFSNSTLVVHKTQSHMQQVGLMVQLCSGDHHLLITLSLSYCFTAVPIFVILSSVLMAQKYS